MTETVTITLIFLIYRLSLLVVGILSIYMGYRLFLADKVSPAGDLSMSARDYALHVKGGAPGVFFSLFGTILIAISIIKGWSYEETPVAAEPAPKVRQIIPDEPPFPD